MNKILTFSFDRYREFLKKFQPARAFTPFYRINRSGFDRLWQTSGYKGIDFSPLQDRLSPDEFCQIRASISLTLKYAQQYFPAYPFLVNDFLNAEWLSIVDWKKYHRDHVAHQAMVAYICMELLDLKLPGENGGGGAVTLLDKAVDAVLKHTRCSYIIDYLLKMGAPKKCLKNDVMQRFLWKWIFRDTLFTTALFHDMGYPWRFISQLNENIDPFILYDDPATQSADRINETYGHRLMFYPLNGYRRPGPDRPAHWASQFAKLIKRSISKTHGMPGAVTFLYLNDLLRHYPDEPNASPFNQFCVEWAAMAILMHDMAKIYRPDGKARNHQLRLSFNQDPLSCILTLADLLQEFSRPNAEFNGKTIDGDVVETTGHAESSSTTSLDYQKKCDAVHLLWFPSEGKMRIIYKYKRYGDYVQKQTMFIPKEQRLYFDPREGYLDFSEIGLKEIELDAVWVEP